MTSRVRGGGGGAVQSDLAGNSIDIVPKEPFLSWKPRKKAAELKNNTKEKLWVTSKKQKAAAVCCQVSRPLCILFFYNVSKPFLPFNVMKGSKHREVAAWSYRSLINNQTTEANRQCQRRWQLTLVSATYTGDKTVEPLSV